MGRGLWGFGNGMVEKQKIGWNHIKDDLIDTQLVTKLPQNAVITPPIGNLLNITHNFFF